jgi:ABC-type hemin transport system substrate-binding protein
LFHKRHKSTTYLLITLLVLSILSGCKAKKQDNQKRYVVLSPEVAEIMAALDLGSDIVGLTDECT